MPRARWLSNLELGAENVAAFIGERPDSARKLAVLFRLSTHWPEIQRICDQYGILLVADDVICGFARTGESVCSRVTLASART